ncbi:uncharacterized protein [Dysidea avara]|uniref:uncharacterized protein isoform X2 n=1 Tax=Dysidea avara TaxID=196820 RepID=UPI0033200E9F
MGNSEDVDVISISLVARIIVLLLSTQLIYCELTISTCDLQIRVDENTITCISTGPNISCPNLDSAFNHTAEYSGTIANCVHINLSSSSVNYHVINLPLALNVSLVLTGAGSTVKCDYESNVDPVFEPSQLRYTLFFSEVPYVVFDGVHFESCPEPFRMEAVGNVTISDSYFTKFSEAVFDLHNCLHITIANSTFIDNYGSGALLLPFRGNTGAVSIGYNNYNITNTAVVLITDSSFIANQARVKTETFQDSTGAFLDGRFTGRGGGLAILMNPSSGNLSINVRRCNFSDNYAVSFGGALYMILSANQQYYEVTIEDSLFINNRVDNGGGGIQLSYTSAQGLPGYPVTATIRNCSFIGNRAIIGSGSFFFILSPQKYSIAIFENCYYYQNEAVETGGAILVSQFAFFEFQEILTSHRVINCFFIENISPDGVVAFVYGSMELTGVNTFQHNYGLSLRVVGTLVNVYDTVIFEDNNSQSSQFGGALNVESFGQVRVFPQTNMIFNRNIGSIGTAIAVQTQTTSDVYSRLIHNSQCFLLYLDKETPFVDLNNDTFSFTFVDNQALTAPTLYLFTTIQCSWIGNEPPYFTSNSVLDWDFINTNNDSDIQTTAQWLILPNNVTGWPGQVISTDIRVLDELNFNTYGTIELLPSNMEGEVIIDQNIQVISNSDANGGRLLRVDYALDGNIAARLKSNHSLMLTVEITLREIFSSAQGTMFLTIVPCIAGYKLVNNNGIFTCQCNLDADYIVQCESDQVTILLEDGFWAVSDRSDTDNNLKVYPCPPGYCRCSQLTSFGNDECHFVFNTSYPNKQCDCSREGYLCGSCRDGKGVSALFNECVDCSDGFGALIAVLIIVDAIIIIGILIKSIQLPNWLLPAIFNIQMVAYVGEYYPVTYQQTGRYISYIGSTISLYFPYDFCLYSGTTALASYSLRYIPFCLSLILSSGFFVYFYKIQRKHGVRTKGIWTLILLLYSHVMYTSLSILHCPSINDSNSPRWFYNGTVECFYDGGHTVLGLWAIAVLIFCLVILVFSGLVSKQMLQVSHVSSLQNTMVVCGGFGKKGTTVTFHHRSSYEHVSIDFNTDDDFYTLCVFDALQGNAG